MSFILAGHIPPFFNWAYLQLLLILAALQKSLGNEATNIGQLPYKLRTCTSRAQGQGKLFFTCIRDYLGSECHPLRIAAMQHRFHTPMDAYENDAA